MTYIASAEAAATSDSVDHESMSFSLQYPSNSSKRSISYIPGKLELDRNNVEKSGKTEDTNALIGGPTTKRVRRTEGELIQY